MRAKTRGAFLAGMSSAGGVESAKRFLACSKNRPTPSNKTVIKSSP
jgi:hypothetical protein